jgi:hypothetical protein
MVARFGRSAGTGDLGEDNLGATSLTNGRAKGESEG